MSAALPGRPIQNEAPDTTDRFQTSVLLILGLTLIGAASIALGFASGSAPAVAIGAGVVLAAGAISVFSALAGSRFRFESAFTGAITARTFSRATHSPDSVEHSGSARDVEAGERSAHPDSAPVRPRELLQTDLRRHPFPRAN